MKILILASGIALVLASTQTVMAQTDKNSPPTGGTQSIAVLNHIAVYVSDLKIATDFYKQVFELPIVPEPFKDGRHTWFSLGPAGQLHLIQGAKSRQIHDKNEHLCFSVASIDDFTAKLQSKNITYENWAGEPQTATSRPDGVKQIYFKDPDGHWLEVNDDHNSHLP